jgi:hypothetical protein
MGRVNYAVELGFDIYDENGLILAAQIAGSGAPAAGAPFAAQPIGSIYQRSNGEFYVKTANVDAPADWALVPIVLSAGYSPANGDPTIGDSFEVAIEKLDANQDDIQTASGLAQGAVDNGTFTGATISDNVTTKAALQEIETAYEETDANVDSLITLSGVAENATDLGAFTGVTIPDTSTNKAALQSLETALEAIEGGFAVLVTNITTLQDVDTFLVDNAHSLEWEIVAYEEATPANKIFQKITAMHNGTAAADATAVDDTVHTKLKVGANFNLDISVDISGAAGAQVMRLRAASSTAGVAMEVRRTGVLIT